MEDKKGLRREVLSSVHDASIIAAGFAPATAAATEAAQQGQLPGPGHAEGSRQLHFSV